MTPCFLSTQIICFLVISSLATVFYRSWAVHIIYHFLRNEYFLSNLACSTLQEVRDLWGISVVDVVQFSSQAKRLQLTFWYPYKTQRFSITNSYWQRLLFQWKVARFWIKIIETMFWSCFLTLPYSALDQRVKEFFTRIFIWCEVSLCFSLKNPQNMSMPCEMNLWASCFFLNDVCSLIY